MAYILAQSSTGQKAQTGPNPQLPPLAVPKKVSGSTNVPTTPKVSGSFQLSSAGQKAIGQVPVAANNSVVQAGTPGAISPAQAAATGAGVVGGNAYSFMSDPALQMVMAQQTLAIQQAQSTALAQEQQALIAYGDPNLAMSVLGDQNVAAAAANNPNSTLATLAATNAQNVRNTNETENKANLWYSSDRGYQLGLQQQAYLSQQGQALGAFNSNWGTIQNTLLAAEQNAWDAEAQAQETAYQNAIANPVGVPVSTATTTTTNPASVMPAPTQPAVASPLSQSAAAQNQAYVSSPVGQQMAAQVVAKPASAGSSGAGGVLSSPVKVNYQAAARAR